MLGGSPAGRAAAESERVSRASSGLWRAGGARAGGSMGRPGGDGEGLPWNVATSPWRAASYMRVAKATISGESGVMAEGGGLEDMSVVESGLGFSVNGKYGRGETRMMMRIRMTEE